jgi:hypothetical protein
LEADGAGKAVGATVANAHTKKRKSGPPEVGRYKTESMLCPAFAF